MGFPNLSPSYGLGSYSRTAGALFISSPRTKLGSQNRIYAWMKKNNKGRQYLNTIGPLIMERKRK